MRRCLLTDRAHLAMIQRNSIASVYRKTAATGINLRLEDFTPLLDTTGGEAVLLAVHRLVTYLTETQDELSLGVTSIEPELVYLTIERLEYYIEYQDCHKLDSVEVIKSVELTHQILSALFSVYTIICSNSHMMTLARIVSADGITEQSLAQQLDDSNSLVRRLLRAAQSIIEKCNLRQYEPVTMALRLIGNLASYGLCISRYLLCSGIIDCICALMNTGLYNCFTSIRAEIQWVFTAIASHFPNDQGGSELVTLLDKDISTNSLSKTYLDIALRSSTDCITSFLHSIDTHSDVKLYDRWQLSLFWFLYAFMCPCLVSRDSISNTSILELIVKSISIVSHDVSRTAIAALNQYSMNVPTDTKKLTLFTNQMITLLRHSFASIFSAHIDACVHGKVDLYYLSSLKEALIFLNNENSETEIFGFWVPSIANLYAKLLRAHRNLTADDTEILELLTETLGSVISICSNETLELLCSSNIQIFSQLVKLLTSYVHTPGIPTRYTWKNNSILLNVSELLRTMINYVPEVDIQFHKQDLLKAINFLLIEDIDVQTANILEELYRNLHPNDN